MMSADAQKHYTRYTENAALAAEIESHSRGWACVVRFYAALHLINAYLIDKGNLRFDPGSTEHKERKQAMAKCPELRDAPEKYRRLKDLSEEVRYKVGIPFTDEDHEASKRHLSKIAAIVQPKLKR